MRQSELGNIVASGRATPEQWDEYWSAYAEDVAGNGTMSVVNGSNDKGVLVGFYVDEICRSRPGEISTLAAR